MKIPETEVTQKTVGLMMTILGVIISATIWVHLQESHRISSIAAWKEYNALWELPIAERRERVRKGLALLDEQETQ